MEMDIPPGSSDAESIDSDRELQIAFEKGLLKPGLNYAANNQPKRAPINNKAGLAAALASLSNGAEWIERLDVSTTRQSVKSGDEKDNDFARETSFYTQAQASVAVAIGKLQKLKVPIFRPDDYYAQMAKSDKHMQKVRGHLLTVQKDKERAAAVRQLREQRKYASSVQKKVAVERQSDKRKLQLAVKQHRKGMKDKLQEMLGDKAPERPQQQQKHKPMHQRTLSKKRDAKNQKYGFGGRKKGRKGNTKDSANDMSGYSHTAGIKTNKKGRPMKGAPNRVGKRRGGKAKRPGKLARASKKRG